VSMTQLAPLKWSRLAIAAKSIVASPD
jgi:hypothetical protein